MKALPRVTFYAAHLIVFNYETVNACVEMHFAPTSNDLIAHVFDNTWQTIGSDMRVRIN